MSSVSAPDRQTARQRDIDRVCEQFESAWRAGRAITIENLVRQPRSLTYCESLLGELIAVEIELRREQRATPTPAEYMRRFPWFSGKINLVFEEDPPSDSLHDPRASRRADPVDAADTICVPGYQVIEELGRGSMGVVYKARDLKLNRLVALKLIQPEASLPHVVKRHFQHEARTIANLRHSGIVQIFGIDDLEGRPYLVLELIDGCGLNQWLDGSPQQEEWAAVLTARVARPLHYAHQQGVIHRDIKPANILLTAPRGVLSSPTLDDSLPRHPVSECAEPDDVPAPVITDFGLAKQLFSTTTVSGRGSMLGTPSYMSPEQAEGRSSEVTPSSDIYALGAVLYEMLTGRPPVDGATPLETLRNVVREKPAPVRRLRPGVSPSLDAICQRCLNKDPAARFPTASALADALHGYLVAHDSPAVDSEAYKVTHRRFGEVVNLGVSALGRFFDRGLAGLSLRRSA